MNALRMPRRCSCVVSVAVESERSASSVASGTTTARGALTPVAAARISGETFGIAPIGSSGTSSSTTVLRSVPTPSTSTSTTSPGASGREFAGVPVRITSPGSSVISRERSAISVANEKISSLEFPSCTTSPFTDVRSVRFPRSSSLAGTSRGPIGVKPSCPFARTFEPASGQRRS